MKMQLYEIANSFSIKNETRDLKAEIGKSGVIVKEPNDKELAKAFDLPTSVSLDIRSFARSISSDPTCCAFKTFGDDVVKELQEEKVARHLSAPCMSVLSSAHQKEYIKMIKAITNDLTRQYKTDIKDSIVGSAESRANDSLKTATAKHKARWRTVPDRLQSDETEIGGLVIRRHLMHTFGDTRDFIAKSDKWFEEKHAELGIKLGSPPWIAGLAVYISAGGETEYT